MTSISGIKRLKNFRPDVGQKLKDKPSEADPYKLKVRLEKVFREINRADFMLPGTKELAYIDAPFSIGYGQTISQPFTVRKMLEWLDVNHGFNVLDVGSGSGWTSVLLASLVGPSGKITAVERIPELVEMGKQNASKYGFNNLIFYQAGNGLGNPESAPFDRILVSASSTNIPPELIQQLKPGGRMVIPVGFDIKVVDKREDEIQITSHPGFVFVPLVMC